MTQPNEPDWERAVEALAPVPAQQQATNQLVQASTMAPLANDEIERLVATAVAADRPRAPSRSWARWAAVAGVLLIVAGIAARRGTLAWSRQRPATSRWTLQEAARQALIHPDEATRSDAVALLETHGGDAIAQLRDPSQSAALALLRLQAMGPAGATLHEALATPLSTPVAGLPGAAIAGHFAAAAIRVSRATASGTADGAAAAVATFHASVAAIESAPLTTTKAQAERRVCLRWLRLQASPLSESRFAAPAHRAR